MPELAFKIVFILAVIGFCLIIIAFFLLLVKFSFIFFPEFNLMGIHFSPEILQ